MSLFVTAPGISGTYMLCFSQSIDKLIVTPVEKQVFNNSSVHFRIFSPAPNYNHT